MEVMSVMMSMCMEIAAMVSWHLVVVEDVTPELINFLFFASVVVLCKNQFYYFPALWPDSGEVAVDETDLLDILR